MQESFLEKIRREYIEQNLENATLMDYSELCSNANVTTVMYKDLSETEVDGYPFASDFVLPDGRRITVEQYDGLTDEEKKQCELRYYYLPNAHEVYIGSTGCGKTTGCVEPQLRAISSQKNKPSLFVTDPKGELFDHNARHLKAQGYNTFVLNFKNLTRTDKWDPLLEMYDKQMELLECGRDYQCYSGELRDDGLEKVGTDEQFREASIFFTYKGMVFPSEQAFDEYIAYEKDSYEASIDSLVNQYVHMMIVVQSNHDKSWEYGAQDLLKGIIQCMLEEAADPNSGFTRDHMNFRTMYEYYNAIKIPVLANDSSLRNLPFIKNKSEKAKRFMATALDNAPNTMRSYCGVFDSAVKDWFQGHIFALTCGHTIDMFKDPDKPFAIFLITRDYEKSDFTIASLFVDWVYRQVLERVENGTYHRPLHFLLDEFGNIPTIKDFENKVSTARSRNIWFHIVLQSYNQLINNYGQQISTIILDNCSQVFLGSTNIETRCTFSQACGKRTVPSLSSRLSTTDNSVSEVPLIPVSSLNDIKPGQIITLRYGMPVIMSQFIRSYILAEQGTFADRLIADGLKKFTPIHVESFTSDKYCYDPSKRIKDEDDDDDDDDAFGFKRRYRF